jgi:N-acyl-D-aspartate/D-glutamate deacylase
LTLKPINLNTSAAQRLEKSTAAARRKGRVQEGADADLIAFDPKTVADRATYQSPRAPSVGMRYEIVNGTVLIEEGGTAPA